MKKWRHKEVNNSHGYTLGNGRIKVINQISLSPQHKFFKLIMILESTCPSPLTYRRGNRVPERLSDLSRDTQLFNCIKNWQPEESMTGPGTGGRSLNTLLFSAGPSRHWCSLPFSPPKPCLHPVPAVPTWMSLSILASDFFAPGDLYHHSALAIHTQPGPGSSIPTSSSNYDHSFPSFQLPYPHITKFVRDSQGFTSSRPTVHLPAYPSPSWGPWTTLSAAPSIFTIHIHSVFHLAESQCWGKATLHLLHPTPQPPDC